MSTETIQSVAFAATLLALAAGVIVIGLHLARTEVDPLVDGVSAYALGPFGNLYRIQAVATGLAALSLTVALVAGDLASGFAVVLLAAFGASRILIARYATDPRGTTSFSRAGRIHIVLAAITFVTIAIAAPAIGGTLASSTGWDGPATVMSAVGWITSACALGNFASATLPATRRIFGLVERGAYAGMLGWLAIAAAGVNGVAWRGSPRRPSSPGSARPDTRGRSRGCRPWPSRPRRAGSPTQPPVRRTAR